MMDSVRHWYNGPLAELQARARALEKLDAQVRELLPSPLREHCRLANLRDDTLVLQVDSAVWATQLRFFKATLLRAWPDCGYAKPRQVEIHVLSGSAPAAPLPPRPELSPANAELLESTAGTLKDPGLQRALRHLARNARRK